ncbi:MAG: hypothetical protein WCW26_02705 [Candidatus Buchananbacteria bacterium]
MGNFDFLKKWNLSPATILKIAGLILAAIILLALVFRLLGSSFNSLIGNNGLKDLAVFNQSESYDMAQVASSKSAGYGMMGSTAGLSIRNVVTSPTIAPRQGTVGDKAEEFEVTEYNSTIKTRQLEKTCAIFIGLKAKDYVIFENANQSEKNCYFTFKVKNQNVEEILSTIKSLKPKELSQSTYTIKKLVDDYTGQLEILEKKKQSINETLDSAIKSYDEITALATRTQDAASLAKIIDSKINIIERLTQERININEQIDLLNRSKSDQLDRLEYTYFYVNIAEDKYVDFVSLRDSWQAAIKEFVRDINRVAQDITINLIALLFYLFQYAVYFFILLVVAKYGWQLAKHIWKK